MVWDIDFSAIPWVGMGLGLEILSRRGILWVLFGLSLGMGYPWNRWYGRYIRGTPSGKWEVYSRYIPRAIPKLMIIIMTTMMLRILRMIKCWNDAEDAEDAEDTEDAEDAEDTAHD